MQYASQGRICSLLQLAPPVKKSHCSCCTSRGIWPALWQASSRNGTPAAAAAAPTAAASYTLPLLVGTWLIATNAGRGCKIQAQNTAEKVKWQPNSMNAAASGMVGSLASINHQKSMDMSGVQSCLHVEVAGHIEPSLLSVQHHHNCTVSDLRAATAAAAVHKAVPLWSRAA
jgi:hypothetical protein